MNLSNQEIESYSQKKVKLQQQLVVEKEKTNNENEIQWLQEEIKGLELKYTDKLEETKEYEEIVDELYIEKEENEKKLLDLNIELEKSKVNNQKLQQENIDLANLKNQKDDREAEKLKREWDIKYQELNFAPDVYKQVIKNFNYLEISNIERILSEMIFTDDPRALSGNRGKMHLSGEEHIAVKVNGEGRIFYEINPENINSSIKILRIVRHNDSRYGKW